ncbi:MAG: hypothetical protein RLY16_225 [Bacteroidota bacterium]|jgi:pimeloyl-ACP methyl ester carboxylesterase
MKREIILLGCLIIVGFQISCKKTEPITPPTQPATVTKVTIAYNAISGVDANLLSLDIYHFGTTNPQSPVVVYVHGGAWAIGDKANSIENKKSLFASLGYILVSINYRLSPSSPSNDPNRVMFPTHNNDVADAVKWVYDHIGTYGGNKQKMVLLGHSAGAHLVCLTGTSNQFLPSRGISLNAIRGIASIDTEGYDVALQCNDNNANYLNAFGTVAANWLLASPIHQLSAGVTYPNFFVAKRGTVNRIALADSFISKLQSVGVGVNQITANQYDHEGINEAIGAAGETVVTDPLKAFLAQCFL